MFILNKTTEKIKMKKREREEKYLNDNLCRKFYEKVKN
jgi:hypothetical protein